MLTIFSHCRICKYNYRTKRYGSISRKSIWMGQNVAGAGVWESDLDIEENL